MGERGQKFGQVRCDESMESGFVAVDSLGDPAVSLWADRGVLEAEFRVFGDENSERCCDSVACK